MHIETNEHILLNILNEIKAENGVEKHKAFIKELVARYPKKGIQVTCEKYEGDYFNYDDHKYSTYTDVETLPLIDDINDYRHIEDIKLTFDINSQTVNAEFIYETHHYIVLRKTIKYGLGEM